MSKWTIVVSLILGAFTAYAVYHFLLFPSSVSSPPVDNPASKKVLTPYLPTKEKYLVNAGEKIKAVISGKITHLGPVDNASGRALNLILHNQKTDETISYLLPDNAQALVKINQLVRAGDAVAVIQVGGKNLDCLDDANLSITYLKNGEVIPLEKQQYQ